MSLRHRWGGTTLAHDLELEPFTSEEVICR